MDAEQQREELEKVRERIAAVNELIWQCEDELINLYQKERELLGE